MTRDEDRREKALESNIEKLLHRSRPEVELKQDQKERILKVLQASASASGTGARRRSGRGAPRIAGRVAGWVAAAAAVLVVFLLTLWPGGGLQQGVVWADVARHLEEVTSFTAWATLEETTPSGERVVRHARIYQKDPALTRTELLAAGDSYPPADGAVAPDSIQSITITSSEPERATILRLDPQEKKAYRTMLLFAGNEASLRGAMRRHLVSGVWARLKYLTSNLTRAIGWREINGVPVVGFEAEMREMFGKPALEPIDGWVRVWASEDEGVPVRVELEFTGPEGSTHRTTYGQLEWNVELPDELFAVPQDGEWTILEEEAPSPLPHGGRLKDGVTLSVGARGEAPVVTEEDVQEIRLVEPRPPAGGDRSRLSLSIRLTPEAGERLREYTSERIGERVVIDFNREVETEVTIAAEIGGMLRLDLSQLSLTPEEFARAYLAD